MNTDITGEFALSGSLFLDCRNAADFTDLNHVIYGHHMEKKTMLGELECFAERPFLKNIGMAGCIIMVGIMDWNLSHFWKQTHTMI